MANPGVWSMHIALYRLWVKQGLSQLGSDKSSSVSYSSWIRNNGEKNLAACITHSSTLTHRSNEFKRRGKKTFRIEFIFPNMKDDDDDERERPLFTTAIIIILVWFEIGRRGKNEEKSVAVRVRWGNWRALGRIFISLSALPLFIITHSIIVWALIWTRNRAALFRVFHCIRTHIIVHACTHKETHASKYTHVQSSSHIWDIWP